MKYSLSVIILMSLSVQTYAEKNHCEKIWQKNKNAYQHIKVYAEPVPCKHVWEDSNKTIIVQNMGLNPKDNQWLSTGKCKMIEVNKNKYQVYSASFQKDHSDLQIIDDGKGHYFGFFRDLGKFDLVDNKFYPNKKANENGVELKCSNIGNTNTLEPVLSSYISSKRIDLEKFSFEDLNK